MSVAQKMPPSTEAAATYGKPNAPAFETSTIATETASTIASDAASSLLRLTRSATTPTNGPHNASGSIHNIGTADTSSGEPVIWNV